MSPCPAAVPASARAARPARAGTGRLAPYAQRNLPGRAGAVLLWGMVAAAAWAAPAAAQAPTPRTPVAPQPHADVGGGMTFALAGDAIITRKLSPFQEQEFLALREIISGQTAAFVNGEILFHDYEEDVIPASESGGTYMRAEPELAHELTWMGFDVVGLANNHSLDFSAGGMRRTIAAVRAAGLAHAGTGENLALARAAGYLETPRGRVALISVASTFASHMAAGPQRKDMRGRPGLSPIRFETTRVVPRERLEEIRRVRDGLQGAPERDNPDRVTLGGVTFAVGADFDVVTTPNEDDLAEIEAAVRDAKRQADWVIVSSHSHEGDGDREIPARFLTTFARAVIDAGADMFVGHGPHVLRGIEVHNGRPIFYSMANFIFQNETVELQPGDNYRRYDLGEDALTADFFDGRENASAGSFPNDPAFWESVVATVRFEGGQLAEVRLYPITLGYALPRAVRGRPLLAAPEQGRRILEKLQTLSQPFGTRIEIQGGVGVIRAARTEDAGGRPR